jgi:hypothetical protein
MDKNELSRIADLAAGDGAPQASILTPEVRSGSSFTYAGAGTDVVPAFLVVWFYTVPTGKRADFALKVNAYETSGVLPQAASGIFYRGTYSVSISAVAPDLEYRTVWGLTDLAKIQNLNDLLRNPQPQLKDVLDLIAVLPAMRSEIMGRTKNSASMTSIN